jgi:hypothetical protein
MTLQPGQDPTAARSSGIFFSASGRSAQAMHPSTLAGRGCGNRRLPIACGTLDTFLSAAIFFRDPPRPTDIHLATMPASPTRARGLGKTASVLPQLVAHLAAARLST